jgi:uncharacterized membrane protein (UPF0127 family)
MVSTLPIKQFKLRLAGTVMERLLGLLRKGVCSDGEVLLLLPCSSVHSFGMKDGIDIAFIDRQGRVIKAVTALPPGRLCSCSTAYGTLERRVSAAAPWFVEGDYIKLSI